MDKMKMASIDMTQVNIEKIEALFPNCITETRDENGELKKAVNFEMLKQMLSPEILEGDEAYEFTWVGKKASILEANKPIRKTLRPCPEESVNWDSTENLYIEGDNLEVLKLLQESYLGKIKMIYIDPPYNTGKDFIYPDSFIMGHDEYNDGIGYFDENGGINYSRENSESAGRYHSDWCSMIYSRLLMVRTLMADDGFIAISIGEEESFNLREICNEVFGESNFRNILAVRRYDKNLNLQFVKDGLTSMNVGLEYILIYSRYKSAKMSAVYKPASEQRQKKGYWKGFWNNADRPTMRYEILGVQPKNGQWKWKRDIADEAVNNYQVYQATYQEKMSIEEYWEMTGKTKRFLRRNTNGRGKNKGVEHWVAPSDLILRNSNWSDFLISKTSDIGITFDSPKNPDILVELMKLFGLKQDDIIMDFFSGSSTTAQAVMKSNAETQGQYRFIMVQVQEPCGENTDAYKAGFKNICEIGKERIRRAGRKIIEEHPEVADSLDIGFRVLKLDDSNMKDVYYNPSEYSQDLLSQMESNVKEDRTDLDLLFGCLLEWGLPLSLSYSSETMEGCTVHNYNDGDLIACFDEKIPDSVIKEIAKQKPLRAVFRDSSFADSPSKINVGEIFKLLSPDTRVKVI